jgi:hypothetical protein
MPTITEKPVEAYAHCNNALCPGYGQEKVKAVEEVTEWTFVDNGGDIPGVERSRSLLKFASDDDISCGTCGRERELSKDPRRNYENLSGFDPMGLINGKVPGFNPAVVNTEADARVAELEAQIARQGAMLEQLLQNLGGD